MIFLGTTTTTASNGEGEEMIVSDANHGQEGQYVSFHFYNFLVLNFPDPVLGRHKI